MALKQLELGVGEGIVTDIRAVRKDYFLDHDHSAYVGRWDWKLAITEEQRNLVFLTQVVKKIRKVLKGAEDHVQELSPQIKTDKYPCTGVKRVTNHSMRLLLGACIRR